MSQSTHMLKKIIVTLLFMATSACWAADTYDLATNELTIQKVLANGVVYTNVVITVGADVQVQGGTPNGSLDIYDVATQKLFIPAVMVGGVTYTNVSISIGQILRVGGIASDGDASTDSAAANSSSVLVTSFISVN
jgi:hypothetical protein